MASYYDSYFPHYIPVAERCRRAAKKVASLKKGGRAISPVEITGRKIATTFWGEAWCKNLEAYSDYANRLSRGRTEECRACRMRPPPAVGAASSCDCLNAIRPPKKMCRLEAGT